jgi:hypothetical protein
VAVGQLAQFGNINLGSSGVWSQTGDAIPNPGKIVVSEDGSTITAGLINEYSSTSPVLVTRHIKILRLDSNGVLNCIAKGNPAFNINQGIDLSLNGTL